jgi:uncharacterized repeat protein (TIGR01451 family)
MLNQILANLQFDSSYRYKLHNFIIKTTKERLVRGLGVIFIVAALLIQILAVIVPTKSGATGSPNDLIVGGFSSQQQLVNDCNANVDLVQITYSYYGVSCTDLQQGSVISLNSTSYNDNLWSVGHLPYGLPGETPVTILGATVYWRPLHAWDTGPSSTYQAVQFTNSQGTTFFVLFTCGNLVSIGFPTPVPPPAPPPTPTPPTTPTPPITPPPTCIYNSQLLASSPECKPPTPPITPPTKPTPCVYNSLLPQDSPNCKPCTSSTSINDTASCLTFSKNASNLTQNLANAEQATANAGDTIRYTLTVANTGKADQPDFIIQDNISDVLVYAKPGDLAGGSIDSNGTLSWPAVTIPAGGVVQKTFTVTVKNPVPDTSTVPMQGQQDVMSNTYSNTINIKVQPTPLQTVIQTISPTAAAPATLVNTGPGASIFIFALVASVAGFIYSTKRLQTKEAKVAMRLSVQEGQI